jgi:hypothetical protein
MDILSQAMNGVLTAQGETPVLLDDSLERRLKTSATECSLRIDDQTVSGTTNGLR